MDNIVQNKWVMHSLIEQKLYSLIGDKDPSRIIKYKLLDFHHFLLDYGNLLDEQYRSKILS